MPLTALEEYFLLEDRPAYPWSFFVRLDFVGRADRTAAENALSACVRQHPLLSSVVRREKGQLHWQPVENPVPGVRWTDDVGEAAYPPAARLDIANEIGVRAEFAVGQETTRLIFQFNHASCDARGAATFIGDWLAEYGRAMGDEAAYGTRRVYDAASLDRRHVHSPSAVKRRDALRMRWTTLRRAASFLAQTPAPLVSYRPAQDEQGTPAGYPAARSFRFDEPATAELRATAKRHGATVNDVLCCHLFLAMRAFRHEMGERPDAWLRVVVPVDLRTERHHNLSAVNMASLVFMTRQAGTLRDPAALLQGIHDEMHQVKTWRLGRTFARGLHLRRYLPGGLERGIRNCKCQGTATMTNIGEIFAGSPLPRKEGRIVAGNLLLDSADFLPPIRPLTCASFSACTYAGRLTLNLHYDPQGLSEAAASQLSETFVGQLRSSFR